LINELSEEVMKNSIVTQCTITSLDETTISTQIENISIPEMNMLLSSQSKKKNTNIRGKNISKTEITEFLYAYVQFISMSSTEKFTNSALWYYIKTAQTVPDQKMLSI